MAIDINWTLVLLGIDGALLAALVVMAMLVSALRRDRRRALAEAAELRESFAQLRNDVAQLSIDAAEATTYQPAPPPVETGIPVPGPYVPTPVLSADKRAEALEMLRNGLDAGAVSAKLQLSPAEATLLEKVQGLLGPAPGRRQ